MRNFLFLTASLFCFALMSGFAAAESPICTSCCDPDPGKPEHRAYCKEQECNILGKTSKDRDNENIIACVFKSDTAGRPDSCDSNGSNCVWKVLTTERPFGKMKAASFLQLEDITKKEEPLNRERQCLWTGGYKDGRRVDNDGPWKNYFACTHACFHYCKGLGFQSGFIAEWSYPKLMSDNSGTAECSCVY